MPCPRQIVYWKFLMWLGCLFNAIPVHYMHWSCMQYNLSKKVVITWEKHILSEIAEENCVYTSCLIRSGNYSIWILLSICICLVYNGLNFVTGNGNPFLCLPLGVIPSSTTFSDIGHLIHISALKAKWYHAEPCYVTDRVEGTASVYTSNYFQHIYVTWPTQAQLHM